MAKSSRTNRGPPPPIMTRRLHCYTRRMFDCALVSVACVCHDSGVIAFSVNNSNIRNNIGHRDWNARDTHLQQWSDKLGPLGSRTRRIASQTTVPNRSRAIKQRTVKMITSMRLSLVPDAPTMDALSLSTSIQYIPFSTMLSSAQQFASQAPSSQDWLSMDADTAEALAGPLFGMSLFPYLAFLYFLNCEESDTPKGITVGFATCLLFVFLTIPAAIASKIFYGVSLADCDWLHGSAESMLTITNLVTVVAFRQAISGREQINNVASSQPIQPPASVTLYGPMVWLVAILTAVATVTVLVPILLENPTVHTPYLGGVLDLPLGLETAWGAHPDPDNALTIATWIIHVSSLVEFLVAMGFCWRWADVVENQRWKGLTWGLLPLHSSGITACTYHLFYNQIPAMVPLQAFLTTIGNTTAAYAAYRIAQSNGWTLSSFLQPSKAEAATQQSATSMRTKKQYESSSLVGFEDLGQALAADTDLTFLVKLFVGCAIVSYVIKYGELFWNFPFEADPHVALIIVFVPSAMNAYKWYRRSQDATFEGWF